jgi:hemerythrin-like metal-binding protein
MLITPRKPLVVLGHALIDGDHGAFLEAVSELIDSDNVGFPTLFRGLLAHTAQHFEREDALMVEHAFPALREHRAEHARVLGEFHQFMARIDRGFLQFGRLFVVERLVPWFELHVPTMDSALVAHLEKARRAG